MKNEKSFRNPFPWIWKVFRYEMKSSARILLPVYITTIAVALSTIMLVTTDGLSDFISTTDPLDEVTFFTAILFFGMCLVAPVITVIILSKRFKTGLFGDEAYMNLMFPVTVGEHLYGRILSVIIWFFVCLATELLSFLIFDVSKINLDSLVKFWNKFPFLMIMTIFMALVLFIYFVNSVAHLAKKHRTIVKVVTVTVMLSFVFRIIVAILNLDLRIVSEEHVFSLFFAALSAIYAVVTYFILKYRLNLE